MSLYEVVNYDRRESLLALVPSGLGPLVSRLRSPRPPPIEHWGPDEVYAIEQVAVSISVADAEILLEIYLTSVRWPGWTMAVWRG